MQYLYVYVHTRERVCVERRERLDRCACVLEKRRERLDRCSCVLRVHAAECFYVLYFVCGMLYFSLGPSYELISGPRVIWVIYSLHFSPSMSSYEGLVSCEREWILASSNHLVASIQQNMPLKIAWLTHSLSLSLSHAHSHTHVYILYHCRCLELTIFFFLRLTALSRIPPRSCTSTTRWLVSRWVTRCQ
jgi:hypothetical protein